MRGRVGPIVAARAATVAVALVAAVAAPAVARGDVDAVKAKAQEGFDRLAAKDYGAAREALEAAVADADKALKSAAKGPGERSVLLYTRSTCQVKLRRFGEARAGYQEILETEPDFAGAFLPNFPDVRIELARIAFLFGDDEAIEPLLAKSAGGLYADTLRELVTGGPRAEGGVGKTPGGGYVLVTDVGAGGKVDKKSGMLATWLEMATMLDLVRKAFATYFPGSKAGEVVSRVYVFADKAAFDAFAKKTGGATSEKAFGYYDPDFKVIAIHEAGGDKVGSLGKDAWDTLLHEAVHQFIDMNVLGAPRWFHEGMAEYFGPSTITVARKKKVLQFGINPRLVDMDYILNPKKYAEPEKAPKPKPLERLLTGAAPWEGSEADYAQAWSVIHYLAQGVKGGDKIIANLWKELQKGAKPGEAAKKAFKKVKWAKLEAGWRDYVTKLAEQHKR